MPTNSDQNELLAKLILLVVLFSILSSMMMVEAISLILLNRN